MIDLVDIKSDGSHDCIVAVSGGKDSHALVLKVLDLDKRPLAVCATTDHLTLFELAAKVPTSLPVTGQNFTPFIIIAALIFALAIVGVGVLARRRLKT